MLTYPQYFRKFGYRKPTDLRRVFRYTDLNEIPNGAILHSFCDLGKEIGLDVSSLPELYLLEKFQSPTKNLYYFVNDVQVSQCPDPNMKVGHIRHAAIKSMAQLRKLRDGKHRFIYDPTELMSNISIKAFVFYSSLMRSHITGRIPRPNIVELTLNKLLHIADVNEHTHFVIIPTEDIQVSPINFNKAIRSFDLMSYERPESYYFTLLMHVYCYLDPHSTDSIFEKVSTELLSRINFIFINPDTDKCVHVRLDKLKEFTAKDLVIGKKLLHVLNTVSKNIELDKKLEPIDETLITVQHSAGTVQPKLPSPPIQQKSDTEIATTYVRQTQEAATTVTFKVDTNKNLSPTQKKVAKENIAKYKTVQLNGKTLDQHLAKVVPTTPKDNTVQVAIPDRSVKSSKLCTLPTDYMKNQYEKDLTSVLTSLTYKGEGMFLTKLETEEISDDLNEIVRYTATFKDPRGEAHTIRFRVPAVDDQGYCMINGSLKKLTSQRINNPICKTGPTRVTLSSAGNKTIVERNDSFSNSLLKQLRSYLSKTQVHQEIILGSLTYPDIVLPLDYVSLAAGYRKITVGQLSLTFDYLKRFEDTSKGAELMKTEQQEGWVYLGTLKGKPCFIDADSIIHYESDTFRMLELFGQVIHDVTMSPYDEWVHVILLNKKFPVMFMLAYRYGFENILDYLKVDYEKIPKGQRIDSTVKDIVVRMNDVTYVLNDVTPVQRLICSGINMFDLSAIESVSMDEKDAYFLMLENKGYSTDYLNRIDFLFEMFLDPMTLNVLEMLNEPTNMRDLFIKASTMLTTGEYREASSCSNFRIRNYEFFNSIIYKVLANELHKYQTKPPGSKRKFSISEYDVFTRIVTDALFSNMDMVNPMTTIKEQAHYTHIGDGGRSADSMMVNDRRYPKDGVGIISEASVDSGKAGIDGYMSNNPTIINNRGISVSKPIKDLKPSEILSSSALLYPIVTSDDPKRA